MCVFYGLQYIAKCAVGISLVYRKLQIAMYTFPWFYMCPASKTIGIKNDLYRRSAEWTCVYFHWFGACHVHILLVLEGSSPIIFYIVVPRMANVSISSGSEHA